MNKFINKRSLTLLTRGICFALLSGSVLCGCGSDHKKDAPEADVTVESSESVDGVPAGTGKNLGLDGRYLLSTQGCNAAAAEIKAKTTDMLSLAIAGQLAVFGLNTGDCKINVSISFDKGSDGVLAAKYIGQAKQGACTGVEVDDALTKNQNWKYSTGDSLLKLTPDSSRECQAFVRR